MKSAVVTVLFMISAGTAQAQGANPPVDPAGFYEYYMDFLTPLAAKLEKQPGMFNGTKSAVLKHLPQYGKKFRYIMNVKANNAVELWAEDKKIQCKGAGSMSGGAPGQGVDTISNLKCTVDVPGPLNGHVELQGVKISVSHDQLLGFKSLKEQDLKMTVSKYVGVTTSVENVEATMEKFKRLQGVER